LSAEQRVTLRDARRWVVKVGSALLTDEGRRLDAEVIETLVAGVVSLRELGHEVVLVSSGAVAAGIVRLGLNARPKDLHTLQAAAAVGQSALVRAYEDALAPRGVIAAQILLSHADVRARDRYLNARSTLNTLLDLGVLPIVNENDTVVTDEIRFGDNDNLAALVANLIDADALLILTDQEGLFDRDPRKFSDAQRVACEDVSNLALDGMVGEGGVLGRGGMVTKLRAARLAARSGTQTVIAYGKTPDVMTAVAAGADVGTLLWTHQQPQSARKQWLASLMHTQGALVVDAGAARVLSDQGRSLLPIGVVGVRGDFQRGDLVRCIDENDCEVARGLVNYSAKEARLLVRCRSQEIESILGYGGDAEMIHRDNLVKV